MNTPPDSRRLSHILTRSLVVPLTAAAVSLSAAPASAETGLNTVPRESWLPLTAADDAPLPDDPQLFTDDCRHDNQLPPAFDAEAQRTPQTPPLITVERPGPGGPGMESCAAAAADGVRLPERLSLGSYLLYDVDSGEVLATKDPYGLYRPASVIKILLVMIALDELDMEQLVPVTDEMANVDGSKVGVGPGGKYTARQLLQGLVMNSGNDAALALSGALGGSEATVTKMQRLAESLGTRATKVTTVNGLDTPESQTTSYDLALMYRAAFQRDDVRALLGTRQISFPGFGENPAFDVSSDNGLLFDYPGTIGGKTGFTDNARHTYSAAASRNGRTLGLVLLNSTIAAGRPWAQAEGIFNAGFAADPQASIGELVTGISSGHVAEDAAPITEDAATPSRRSFPASWGMGLWVGIGVLVIGIAGAGVLVIKRRAVTSAGTSSQESQSS